jgi:hypothetical protein
MDIMQTFLPQSTFRRNPLRAAIYVRVSTPDQRVESQLYDLRELAAQRGFEVVHEYEDRGVCGKKARRPGLDLLVVDHLKTYFCERRMPEGQESVSACFLGIQITLGELVQFEAKVFHIVCRCGMGKDFVDHRLEVGQRANGGKGRNVGGSSQSAD